MRPDPYRPTPFDLLLSYALDIATNPVPREKKKETWVFGSWRMFLKLTSKEDS